VSRSNPGRDASIKARFYDGVTHESRDVDEWGTVGVDCILGNWMQRLRIRDRRQARGV